jgi:soluble lytic murein transglycosylase-like protein
MVRFLSQIRSKSSWVGLCLLLFLQQTAWADVWGYIDAKGVAHFAAERLDDRYELFYKGGESFDSRDGVKAVTETPRPVAVPVAPPKLLAYFEVSPSYKAVKHHLREASNQHDIEYELLQALIATESGFDATAVSPKGAVGLMQLMPATAERYGVRADPKLTLARKLTDPRTNIRAGTRYLRDLINLFPGRLELALAAYNAGEGAVQRAGNQIPNYRETQNYVKTVLQLYHVLKPPPAIAAARRTPARVRVEIAATPGGAIGRGNMPPPVTLDERQE